jgi:hypothetical protein
LTEDICLKEGALDDMKLLLEEDKKTAQSGDAQGNKRACEEGDRESKKARTDEDIE